MRCMSIRDLWCLSVSNFHSQMYSPYAGKMCSSSFCCNNWILDLPVNVDIFFIIPLLTCDIISNVVYPIACEGGVIIMRLELLVFQWCLFCKWWVEWTWYCNLSYSLTFLFLKYCLNNFSNDKLFVYRVVVSLWRRTSSPT